MIIRAVHTVNIKPRTGKIYKAGDFPLQSPLRLSVKKLFELQNTILLLISKNEVNELHQKKVKNTLRI